MEHIAILSKSGKLLDKIISGQKTIESRWYKHKRPPIGIIQPGEIIYFKEAGAPISARAIAKTIQQYDDLNPEKIRILLEKNSKQLGVGIEYLENIKDKKIGILIELESAEKIPPFEIDKTGFGAMNAWITIQKIDVIKKRG